MAEVGTKMVDGAVSVRGRSVRAVSLIQRAGALVALALVGGFAAYRYPQFLTSANLMRQNSMLGLVALGMTFVILTGGIDLSVGSILAVAGVVAAHFAGRGLFIALVAGVAVAGLLGLVNGVVIARARIQPFIVTLAMMIAARGLALVTTGERTWGAARSGWGRLACPCRYSSSSSLTSSAGSFSTTRASVATSIPSAITKRRRG